MEAPREHESVPSPTAASAAPPAPAAPAVPVMPAAPVVEGLRQVRQRLAAQERLQAKGLAELAAAEGQQKLERRQGAAVRIQSLCRGLIERRRLSDDCLTPVPQTFAAQKFVSKRLDAHRLRLLAEVAQLEAKNAQLEAKDAQLEAENAQLVHQMQLLREAQGTSSPAATPPPAATPRAATPRAATPPSAPMPAWLDHAAAQLLEQPASCTALSTASSQESLLSAASSYESVASLPASPQAPSADSGAPEQFTPPPPPPSLTPP